MTKLRTGSPETVGMLPERVAHVRDLCARWVEEGHTPTLGVCVARRGVVVLHESFGTLGPGPDSPRLGQDALFAGASVTKAVTATLVMQLVEDGVLGIESGHLEGTRGAYRLVTPFDRLEVPATVQWRAELAAALGDDVARVQLLREAHHLYEEIGAPLQAQRVGRVLSESAE